MLSLRDYSPAERDAFLKHLHHRHHTGRVGDVNETMWKTNALVRAWYCGFSIDFSEVESNPIIRYMPFDEVIASFCCLNKNKYPRIMVEPIWQANSELRLWYRGEHPDRPLTAEALVNQFKSLLTHGRPYLAIEMWKENDPLQQAFKLLPHPTIKTILKLAKDHTVYQMCLDVLDDVSFEQAFLKDMENAPKSTKKSISLINLLRARINQSKKRKASTDILDVDNESITPAKKQRTETTALDNNFNIANFFSDVRSSTDTLVSSDFDNKMYSSYFLLFGSTKTNDADNFDNEIPRYDFF